MTRGSRPLGIVELVEGLEATTSLLEMVVYADGEVTEAEQRLLDLHRHLTSGTQSLAARTFIGISLLRGLAEPPERVGDLIEDYRTTYGTGVVPFAAD